MKRLLICLLPICLASEGCKKTENSPIGFAAMNGSITVLKCQRAIDPARRMVLDKHEMESQQAMLFNVIIGNGHKTRATYVCCEYFLQTLAGDTIGVLTDDVNKKVTGFDFGRQANAIKLHSKFMHDIILTNDKESAEKAYSLIVQCFQ